LHDAYLSFVALIDPHGTERLFQGEVQGSIASIPRGAPHQTLPYDILFIPIGESRTFGEMAQEEKNAMSHRGLAFEKLKLFLQQ